MTTSVRIWIAILFISLGAYAGISLLRFYEHSRVSAGEQSAVAGVSAAAPAHQKSLEDLADAKLTERSEQPFALKSLAGKVWIGSFFFASCPGTCRQINTAIAGLQQELKDKDVQLVSITVDPENDTPAVLRDYAKSFGADPRRWLFLTGDFDLIKQICGDLFGMPIDRKVHTERLVLFDKAGHRRGVFSTTEPAQMAALRRGINLLLAESPAVTKPEKKVVVIHGDDS